MPRPLPTSALARLTGTAGPKQLRWADPKVGNQQAAFQYGPAPTCLSGGWGAGKTVVAFIKLLFIMDMFPGYRVAVVRKVWDELKKTTMGTLFKLLPPAAYQYSGRRNDQDKVCTLNNGSSFVFLHLDDPEKAGVLGGLEINGFFINQAEQVEEEVFDKLSGRIGRWDYAQVPRTLLDAYQRNGRQWPWRNEQGDPVPPSYQLIDCNPDHEFHWIYRRFHPDSKEHYERKIESEDKTQAGHFGLVSFRDLGYRMFTMDSRDNQFTPKEYKNQLLRRDRSFVDRYVRGLWGNPEGRLHTVPEQSIIPGDPAFVQKLLSTCILYRTLDHGDSSPTACGWWAVDAEKNIYCVSPETKILTADLRWVQAGTVQAGDALVGFDEMPSTTGRRRYRKAAVQATERLMQPCYELTLSDGAKVTCSVNHQWLVKRGVRSEWRTTQQLDIGARLVRALDVWDTDTSYGGGYLAGAYDGEGSMVFNTHGTIIASLAQKDNALLARVSLELTTRRIRHGIYATGRDVFSLVVTRKRDCLRLFGSVRPERLLPKMRVDDLAGFRGYAFPHVVKKEFVGIREVVAMKTSTGTFIAEGLASHNCFREYYMPGKRIGEHRANISALSMNENYAATYADPSIFYEVQSRGFGKGQLHTVYDEYRDCVSLPRSTALFMQPADNNEMGTRNKINELLVVDPGRLHPYTREPGAPRIFFVERSDAYPNGCNMAIREMKAQRREKLGTDLGKPIFSDDRDKSVPDHAYDFIRYMVASSAVAPTMAIAKQGYSFHDARASVKALNKGKGKGWSRLFQLAKVGR